MEKNIDFSKIRAETQPSTFYKNLTNIKRVGPELLLTGINSEDRKTLHIQFVAKLLNDMKDSTIAIFTNGSSLINPGPTSVRTVIFTARMNKPTIKLAKAVSSNSTTYHGEIVAILLVISHILSTQSELSANTVRIFSDCNAAINVMISWSLQEIH